MASIKEYSLSTEIKRKLGRLIKITRQKAQKEYTGLIEMNPYTKENFCKDICHYHTLTKLENQVVKDDMLYHIFLDKLGLIFQLEDEDHQKNMNILNDTLKELLIANEYLDDELLNNIINRLEHMDFTNDSVADIHLKLLKYYTKLQKFISNEDEVNFIILYTTLFHEIYLGMAHHYMGLYYLRLQKIDQAEISLLEAKEIYKQNNVGKGIINPNLINVYEYKLEYSKSVSLCLEMELYYITTKNFNRLIHIYNFLGYFYLMINDFKSGEKYFNRCMKIIDDNSSLIRYKNIIQFNFGVYILKKYGVKESEKYLVDTYKTNNLKEYKFMWKIVALLIMTNLNYNESVIKGLLYDGIEDDEKDETNSNLYKYFRYKYENPGYHRKYALEKLIPYMKERNLVDELLFIYEDLYG